MFKHWSEQSVLKGKHKELRAKGCRDGSKFRTYGEPTGNRMDAEFILEILHSFKVRYRELNVSAEIF